MENPPPGPPGPPGPPSTPGPHGNQPDYPYQPQGYLQPGHDPRMQTSQQPMPRGIFGGPASRHVVQVVAKPGGFSWAIGTIVGLFVLGIVLIVGIFFGAIFGVAGAMGGSMGYQYVEAEPYFEGNSNQIAILPVHGMIDQYQSDFVRNAVNYILNDTSVRAVVLRVDSGGGGVTASDQIWNEVERLKNHGLPVVASFGSVAASGGYYVACDTNFIMAEETCITGSIGVIAQIFTFEDLANKIGIQPVTIVASNSQRKNIANDIFREWNEQDRETVLKLLDSAYATFHTRVSTGRQTVLSSTAAIDQIADGSIYTAQQAVANGLVDGIGYLDDAVQQAEALAGLPKGSASAYRVTPVLGPLQFLFAKNESVTRHHDPLDADRIRNLANELTSPRIMYLMR